MNKIHIHIYRVVGKAEIDLEPELTESINGMLARALDMAERGELDFKPCEFEFLAQNLEAE